MARRTLKARDGQAVDKRLKKTNSEELIAYDGEVVHISGTEYISGSKVFEDDAYFGDGSLNNIIITDSAIKKMTDGSVKTYNLPSAAGTLALEGGIPEHTHSLITSGDGTLSINTSGEAFIETKNAPIGFCVSADVYDSANNASLVVSFIVPMNVEDFSQSTLSAMDSIVWEVKDLTNSVDVIPRQPLFMDFTKYGYDTDNNWLWIAVKDNTVVPNPNYSFPNYNWVQNSMTSPFHIAKNQDGTFSVSETWGPAAFSEDSVAPVAAVVDKTEKVLTEEVAKTTYAKLSHSHNAIKGQSNDIEYTLTITGDSARLDKNSTANNIELTIGRYTPRHPSFIQGYTTIGTTNYRIDAYAGDAYRGGVSYERDKILIYPADYSPAKTILLPSADGRLALEGGVIPEHTHSSIASTNGYTIVSAANTGEATLISEHSEIGMSFVFVTQDQANNVLLEIEMVVHLPDSAFSQDAFENTNTIGIRITDTTNNIDVIQLQEAELDFQAFGHSDPYYYVAIKNNGITVNPNYTFQNYNWISNLYSAPFSIKKNDGNYIIQESWGPIGTQGSISLSPTILYGRTESRILTMAVASDNFPPMAHDHHRITSNSNDDTKFNIVGTDGFFNGQRIWISEHPESGYAIAEDRVEIWRDGVIVSGNDGQMVAALKDNIKYQNTSGSWRFYFPSSGGTFATQSYVDAQIGGINSILDNINGEVI